ncbi:hypothetical protein MRX96_010380 [Rhipicephalus microplus]
MPGSPAASNGGREEPRVLFLILPGTPLDVPALVRDSHGVPRLTLRRHARPEEATRPGKRRTCNTRGGRRRVLMPRRRRAARWSRESPQEERSRERASRRWQRAPAN